MSIIRDGDMTTPARLAAAIGGLVLAPLMLIGPDGEININLGKLRLDDVTPLLDLPGTVIDDRITLGADELDSVCGPWQT